MKEVFIETFSGEYRLGLDGMTIKKAYLRSNIGADRIYSTIKND